MGRGVGTSSQNGQRFSARIVITPRYDNGGKPLGFLLISKDISVELQLTGELEAAQFYVRSLIEASLDPLVTISADGKITDVNQATELVTGVPRQQLIGTDFSDYFTEPDRAREGYRQVFQQGFVRDCPLAIRHSTGRITDVLYNASVYRDERGAVLGVFAAARDITQRKMAEELQRAATYYARSLIEASLDPLVTISVEGKITDVNEASVQATGVSREELIGTNFSDYFTEPDKARAGYQQVFKEGFVRDYALAIRHRNGKITDVLYNASLYRDDKGNPLGVFAAARDMTEQRQFERSLEKANRAKSEFLSRMSHELRTPLNAILGFAQVLELDELTSDQMGSLEQILKSGRHLLDLINEVLDIARIEAGRISISPEPVNLVEALKSATDLIRPMATKRGISIRTKIPSSQDIYVTADRQRLKQVLLNLLSNGVKYNRENGEILVTAGLLVDGFLHLAVRDTGMGIAPEKMERLFTPFDRLELEPDMVEGTGLGLAVSKGLVEAMGGRIGAQSVIGEGSTFWFDLKLTTQQKEAIVMAEVDDYLKDAAGPKKGLVLYVEDNLSNVQLIEKILARLPGVELITAMQGHLAMDLARQHKPALILLDLHLPDVHGEEVLRWLRAEPETRDIPIVVMSADATQHQIERALAAGARAYLTKPIDVKEFLKLVGETLGS